MRGWNSIRVLIAASFILQSGVESTFFDVLKAFISPETRVTRIRNGSPRAQGTKDPLAVLDFVSITIIAQRMKKFRARSRTFSKGKLII